MKTMIAGHLKKLIIFKTFPKNYKIINQLTLHYKKAKIRPQIIRISSNCSPIRTIRHPLITLQSLQTSRTGETCGTSKT